MKTVSSEYLKGLIEGCIAHGVDSTALYALFEEGASAFSNPMRRFPREKLISTVNTAVSLSNDPDLAIKVGMALRPNSLLDIGYALTVCDNIEEALKTNQTYQPLIQQIGQTHLELTPDAAVLIWNPLYESVELYRHFVEIAFAGYVVLGKWLLFGEMNPVIKMEFRHKAPIDSTFAKTVFSDNIIYGAETDKLYFKPELATVPLPSRNPELKQVLFARLDKQLAALGQPQNLSIQILHIVHTLLPDGRPSTSDIAAGLGIGERSLRRKLAEEGTSYGALLLAARKEACDLYLRQGVRSHAQIAQSLGYSDQSAYGRAFKSWFGVAPNAYKQSLSSAIE